jgi:secreted PhoX family phosphatase
LPTIDQGGGLHFVDTGRGLGSFLGQPLPVRWVLLEDVDPTRDTLRFEAQAKGAALFDRGEGAWYSGHGGGKIYFVATSGGALNRGQVFLYDPMRETVTLVVESVESTALISPDNITVAPDGALYLCEDKGGTDSVVGVDSNGNVFPFLRNARDAGEFAGACFSSNGKFMYVNGQAVGITFAVFRDDRRSIRVHSGWV